METRIAALVALLSLLCAGCASNEAYGLAPDVVVTDLTALPAPDRSVDFAFRPLESVEVRVLQDADLSGTYFIDELGNITFPYVGEIRAVGRTPSEIAEIIRSGLDGGYLVDPSVSVRPLGERGTPTVSMGGQIANPGNIPLASNTTLLRAVNLSGGTTDFARKDEVLIFREHAGQRYIGVYNLAAIERGNYQDPLLAPNDIVMVGDSPTARRFASIVQYLPLLTTAIVLLDQTGIIQ